MLFFTSLKAFFITFLALTSLGLSAQPMGAMFPKEILASPIEHANWFDEILEVNKVPKYRSTGKTNKVVLENGYAQHKIIETKDWLRIQQFAIPLEVEIVFTDYPIKKEDWITNYYELLANRLRELFELDGSLNSKEVEWRLAMQTSCVNGIEAEELFHGIVIKYKEIELVALAPLKPQPLKICNYYFFQRDHSKDKNTSAILVVDNKELESILYPESIYNRKVKQVMPSRVQGVPDVKCPSFSTRKDKPKQGIWSRLFKR